MTFRYCFVFSGRIYYIPRRFIICIILKSFSANIERPVSLKCIPLFTIHKLKSCFRNRPLFAGWYIFQMRKVFENLANIPLRTPTIFFIYFLLAKV